METILKHKKVKELTWQIVRAYPRRDDQLYALRKLASEIYKRSLFLTVTDLLGYKDVTPRTHGRIISALESDSKRKLIVCPRGAFKSSICTVAYPIWRLMRNPNERILIDSELFSNSRTFVREIRRHFESQIFRDIFGDWEGSVWTDGQLTVKPQTSAEKEPSISCGGVETTKTGQHYSLIIADDLNSENNSQTIEGREKVIQHYKMYTSLLNPGGTIVVVGTRYATNDVIGYIIEGEIDHE